jgi:hypothetical protein
MEEPLSELVTTIEFGLLMLPMVFPVKFAAPPIKIGPVQMLMEGELVDAAVQLKFA